MTPSTASLVSRFTTVTPRNVAQPGALVAWVVRHDRPAGRAPGAAL